MGIVQKEALITTIISYVGLIVGYINKGFLFIIFLSTEQIGLVNLILSVGLLFGQLSNVGLINTVWRFFPFFRDDKKGHFGFLKGVFKIVFLSSILFSIVSYLIQNQIVILYSEKSKLFVDYYYWIIPIGIGNVIYLISDMFLRGLNKNSISVIANEFFHRFSVTIILLLFGFKFISFDFFVVLFALSYFLPSLILIFVLIKTKELVFSKSSGKISKKFKKILFSYSIFSYFNSIGAMVVITMDAMMIASFLGLKETGIYSTILYLISAMQIPNRSIFRVGTSLVAKYWKDRDMFKMNELYQKVSSISLIISLYTFLIVWLSIDQIFMFLPKDFQVGIYTFLIFMIGKLIDIYFGLNGIIFITSKKYKFDIIFTGFLLVTVYVLNLYLIPTYGINGAAVSTSFAIIVYNVGRLYYLWKWYKLHPFEINQFYIILLFFGIIIGFNLLPEFHFNKIIIIGINSFIVTFIYFTTIIKFKLSVDFNDYLNKICFKLCKRKFKFLA
ncbi:MAG: lipopolysaccharide biosynthesis protein [Flavobacteriia bacterium]|nr:lipopolysaccharide biosynthesis protein [Flavobacteriia bacterium]